MSVGLISVRQVRFSPQTTAPVDPTPPTAPKPRMSETPPVNASRAQISRGSQSIPRLPDSVVPRSKLTSSARTRVPALLVSPRGYDASQRTPRTARSQRTTSRTLHTGYSARTRARNRTLGEVRDSILAMRPERQRRATTVPSTTPGEDLYGRPDISLSSIKLPEQYGKSTIPVFSPEPEVRLGIHLPLWADYTTLGLQDETDEPPETIRQPERVGFSQEVLQHMQSCVRGVNGKWQVVLQAELSTQAMAQMLQVCSYIVPLRQCYILHHAAECR